MKKQLIGVGDLKSLFSMNQESSNSVELFNSPIKEKLNLNSP